MNKELQSLNERIAERIGRDLVELIPADQWQAMVDNEVLKFKRDTAPKIIQKLLEEDFILKAKVRIDELTQGNTYDEMSNDYINEKLTEFIGKSSGVMFAYMLTPTMQTLLQDLRSRLGY